MTFIRGAVGQRSESKKWVTARFGDQLGNMGYATKRFCHSNNSPKPPPGVASILSKGKMVTTPPLIETDTDFKVKSVYMTNIPLLLAWPWQVVNRRRGLGATSSEGS